MLLIDTDPVLPTDAAVRAAIEKLDANLGKAGVAVERESPLLPDFAASTRLYMRMLLSFLAGSFQPEIYAGAREAAGSSPPTTAAWRRSGCAASRSVTATGFWPPAVERGCARNGASCSRASMP